MAAGIDIRLPNITAEDEQGQLRQVKSYLYQLVQQLNYALANISTGTTAAETAMLQAMTAQGGNGSSNFNQIKTLIIKSADIIDAYYDVIEKKLEGKYVASSDFGTYTETTAQQLQANSTNITSMYESLQTILGRLESTEEQLIKVDAHIKTGLLYYDENGVPVYGLEIGQNNTVDGVEVFRKFARISANRMAFYDLNDVEVAYISDLTLHITNAEVTGSFTRGGFIDEIHADEIITYWIGG